MRQFKLYHWYGGFYDCHQEEGTLDTFDELLKRHIQLRPKSRLDNYPDMGNNYYEEIDIIIPKEKKCVWDPNKDKKGNE